MKSLTIKNLCKQIQNKKAITYLTYKKQNQQI